MARPHTVVAVALAVAAASALPLQGRGESARADVGSATGPLVATDGSGAVLVAQGLRPGESRAGEVTVVNSGDTSGALALSQADRVDSPTPAGPLSGVLDLTVTDLTTGRAVFAGKLGALQTAALGNFAQGDSHRYRFVVTFPGGRAPAVDNPYQVVSTTVSYLWSAGPASRPPTVTTIPAPPRPPRARRVVGPAPTVFLTGARRQSARNGALRVRLVCQARCRAWVAGTASVGRARVALTEITRSLPTARGIALRIALPRRARVAMSAGRAVTVRLRVRASIDGRFVTVRRTIWAVAARR
ncbi:MAG: hypothetical protein V7607_5262 [Solirubrobacteraceae bacterium]